MATLHRGQLVGYQLSSTAACIDMLQLRFTIFFFFTSLFSISFFVIPFVLFLFLLSLFFLLFCLSFVFSSLSCIRNFLIDFLYFFSLCLFSLPLFVLLFLLHAHRRTARHLKVVVSFRTTGGSSGAQCLVNRGFPFVSGLPAAIFGCT